MAKKKNVFNLSLLTTLMVLSVAGCNQKTNATDQNSQSFNADDYVLKDVKFESIEVDYDGYPHSILATNVPSGITVTYENNVATEIGKYNAVAHFRSTDGRTIYKDKYATLTILDRTSENSEIFSKLVMEDVTAKYDGQKHTAKLKNPEIVPSGYSIRYVNNSQINYVKNAVAKCEIVNVITGKVHFTVYSFITIEKIDYDMSNVKFVDTTYSYKVGQTQYLRITGKLPEGVTVSYENNAASAPGSQVRATARFYSHDRNYKDPEPMYATLTISSSEECQVTFQYFTNGVFETSRTITRGFGDTISTSDIVEKRGYKYTTNLSSLNNNQSYVLNENNLIVTVDYTEIVYNCSFSVDHGTKESITYKITDKDKLTDPIMDEGYAFIGWFEDEGYTVPIDTLNDKSADIILYGLVREVVQIGTFNIKNTSYTWDGTEKIIDSIGAVPADYQAVITYESFSDTSGESTTPPKDVGTYRVVAHIKSKDTVTGELSDEDAAVQVAYLTIKKAALDTSVMKFEGGTFYIEDKEYPKVKDLRNYINYQENGVSQTRRYRINITYNYYDSFYNSLGTVAPTTEGNYISEASFKITDLDGKDVSSYIEDIPNVSTAFTLVKNTYDLSNIKFNSNIFYSDNTASLIDDYFQLLATDGVETESDENGQVLRDNLGNIRYFHNSTYLSSEGKSYHLVEVVYSNNRIYKNDIGSLTAGMFFKWTDKALELKYNERYNLPAPFYASMSVINQNSCTVTFLDKAGNRLLQTEVVKNQPVAAPVFPDDLNDPNLEYYWESDVGYASSIEKVTVDTVFTMKVREKTYKANFIGVVNNELNDKTNLKNSSVKYYQKSSTDSLNDYEIELFRGYQVNGYKIAIKVPSDDSYFTSAYQRAIKVDSLNHPEWKDLSLFDLYLNLYNQIKGTSLQTVSHIDDLIIFVESTPVTITLNYDLSSGIWKDPLNETKTHDELKQVVDNTYTSQVFDEYYKIPSFIPYKENMKFVGWQINSSFVDSHTLVKITSTQPVTIKAIYEDVSHFTLSLLKGNGESPTVQDIKSNESIPFPENTPTRYGYVFKGWKVNSATSKDGLTPLNEGEIATIEKGAIFNLDLIKKYFTKFNSSGEIISVPDKLQSVILEAIWEYADIKVIFNDYTFNELTGQYNQFKVVTVKYNTPFSLIFPKDNTTSSLLTPDKKGSSFTYWSFNNLRLTDDTLLDTYTVVNGENVLYVTPNYDSEYYTIVYELGFTGSISSTSQVKGSEAYTLAADPKREGYIFKFWYLDTDDEGNPIDFKTKYYDPNDGKYVFTKNIVLKAHFEKRNFQVVFKKQGTDLTWTNPDKRFDYGTVLTTANGGWIDDEGIYQTLRFSTGDEILFTDSDGRELLPNSPLLTSSTEEIYYIYVLSINKQYRVFYYIDTNTYPQTQIVQANVDFALLPAPTKPGMQFVAWTYKSGDVYQEITGNTFRLIANADLYLYASFKPIEYSIRYLSPTGNDIHSETIVTFGQAFSLPGADDIAVEGYTFLYWRDIKGNIIDNNTILLTEPPEFRVIKLYATLKATKYSITYDPRNGKDPSQIDYADYNSNFNIFSNPVREGYTFGGWDFYDANSGAAISSEKSALLNQGTYAYAGNVIARANWIGVTYNITFNFQALEVTDLLTGEVAENLSDLTIVKRVALGTYIDMLNDEFDIFTYVPAAPIPGLEGYTLYKEGDKVYVNPVGLYYNSLSSWKDESTAQEIVNRKLNSATENRVKVLNSKVGGTTFTAIYSNKVQNMSFNFSRLNPNTGTYESSVVTSFEMTFGSPYVLPNYPVNNLYQFYAWVGSLEDTAYDPDKDYKYFAKNTINYNVAFEQYAKKNNYSFNVVYDTFKAYYVVMLDDTKYLKVSPDLELSEQENIYTDGDDISQAGRGQIEKGIGKINLPNIAKNLYNKYYQPIVIDGITFHPCNRTIYKIGGEYLMDGSLYNIGIAGTEDDPVVIKAYSCYVSGQYESIDGKDTYTDFMVFKDTDKDGVKFVKPSTSSKLADSETAFCGFINRNGANDPAKTLSVSCVPDSEGSVDFYIPPYYFDGNRVKRVVMIASNAMGNGAFSNIAFDNANTNIHIPTSVTDIMKDTFTSVGITDAQINLDALSYGTKPKGAIIYEGKLDDYQSKVYCADISLKSANPTHPVWCYDASATAGQDSYIKDVNYSIESIWRKYIGLPDDQNPFKNQDLQNTLQRTKYYIKDNSSITLRYFFGTVEELLQASKNSDQYRHLYDFVGNNEFVACYSGSGDKNNPDGKYYYPRVVYTGSLNSSSAPQPVDEKQLLSRFTSEKQLRGYNIFGMRVTVPTDYRADTKDYSTLKDVYLCDAIYACNNFNNNVFLDVKGDILTGVDNINIFFKYSESNNNFITQYYDLSINDFKNNHADKIQDKPTFIESDIRDIVFTKFTLSDGTAVPMKTFNNVYQAAEIDNVYTYFYNNFRNEYFYMFDDAIAKNQKMNFFGLLNNIVNSSDNMAIASKVASDTNKTSYNITVQVNYQENFANKKSIFFGNTFDNYVSALSEKLALDDIYDGKTLLKVLNENKDSAIDAFLGTMEQFSAVRTSLDYKDNSIIRAVYKFSSNDYGPLFFFTGDRQTLSMNYFGQFANNFVGCVGTSLNPVSQGSEQLIYGGTPTSINSRLKDDESNSTFKRIIKAYLNKTIYAYSFANAGSDLLRVVLSGKEEINLDTLSLQEKEIVFFFAQDNASDPTTTTQDNANQLISLYNDSLKNYFTDKANGNLNLIHLENSMFGFYSKTETGYALSYLGTADKFYKENIINNYDFIRSLANSSNITKQGVNSYRVITQLIDSIPSNVDAMNKYKFLIDYYLLTASQVKENTSIAENRLYKVFDSDASKKPFDYFKGNYDDCINLFNSVIYSYMDVDVKYIEYYRGLKVIYHDEQSLDRLYNGDASEYLSSIYARYGTDEMVRVNHTLNDYNYPYFFFGDILNLTDTTYSFAKYIKAKEVDTQGTVTKPNSQIYALLNNTADTTKDSAKLVVYFNGTENEYRNYFAKYMINDTTVNIKNETDLTQDDKNNHYTVNSSYISPLTNSLNYVFISNSTEGSTKSDHDILFTNISAVTEDILNKAKSSQGKIKLEAKAIYEYKKTTSVNKIKITYTSDSNPSSSENVSSTVTNIYNADIVNVYLGTLKEFNTLKNITDINSYKTQYQDDYIVTLDNATFNSSRTMIPAFFINQNELLNPDNKYFFKKYTTQTTPKEPDPADPSKQIEYLTSTEVDEMLTFDFEHIAYSDVKPIKNVATFNDTQINGLEDTFFAFSPDNSLSHDELLSFMAVHKNNEQVIDQTQKIHAGFTVIADKYDVTNNIYGLYFNGSYISYQTTLPSTLEGLIDQTGDFKYANFVKKEYYDTTNNWELTPIESEANNLMQKYQLQANNNNLKLIKISITLIDEAQQTDDEKICFIYLGTLSELEADYKKLSIYTDDANWLETKKNVYVLNDDKSSVVKAYN